MALRIAIRDDAKAFVKNTAYEDGVKPADVVRKALEAYRFLRHVKACDGELVVRRADGTYERITRSNAAKSQLTAPLPLVTPTPSHLFLGDALISGEGVY